MSRDIKSADEWFGEFDRIREGIAKIRSVLKSLPETEILDFLTILDQELSDIAQTSDDLRWYFCRKPLEKWHTGQQLTREEFYLLAAQGIIVIPSETGSLEAYEEFAYYLYEDNELRGYINPSERPNPSPVPTGNGGSTQEVHLRIGIVPEEVRVSFLRTEQLNFFRNFKPELFSRFRKD